MQRLLIICIHLFSLPTLAQDLTTPFKSCNLEGSIGNDIGWWVGYVERKDNTYFFATRVTKKRSTPNPEFGNCRKTITREVLRQLGAL